MQNAEKKSGTVPFFEPLATEINDCFGALKEVKPDVLFGTHSGLKVQANDDDVIEVDADNEYSEAGATTANQTSEETPKKKQTAKCKIHILISLFT